MRRVSRLRGNALSFLILVGVFAALIPTTASAQAQNTSAAPQNCGATTASTAPSGTTPPANGQNGQNQTIQQSAQNVENAAKQVGSIFKKKPSSSNSSATPAPCPPATATANPPANPAAGATPAAGRGAPAASAPPTATTGVNWNKPFTPPADVKIDVAQLGAVPQGSLFYVSPHGTHVAIQGHAGSRVQMIVDGVPGPVFDSFTSFGSVSLWFSPDGNHYGYCGVSSDHFTVIVDGKQVGTSPDLYISSFDCRIVFSPNSKHFYIISHAGTDANHVHARLIIDGKQEVDIGDVNEQNLIFSPDGEHFAAYLYEYPGKPGPNGTGAMELVVDGKIMNWPGSAPVWSSDSAHLFTMGQSQQGQILYRDGQQVMTASQITLGSALFMPSNPGPPAADAPVAIAHTSNGGAGGVLKEQWYLTVNGKQVPGTLLEKTGGAGSAQIMNLFVSKDGKHYAAIMRGANSKEYLFADGKRGLDYAGINPTSVQFTSGTFEPIYIAVNANVQYLIVGSQETAVPNIGSIIIDPVGDHVATEGDGGVFDGQPLNLSGGNPANTQVHALSFSPDGKNYAYVVLGRGGALTLYVDGAPDTTHSWITPPTGDKTSLWTQGSNIVYECGSTNPATSNQIGLCFDGKYGYMAANPVFGNFTLTPDASHIYFTAGISAGGFRLFLDGVPLLEGFPLSVGAYQPSTWEIEPDGRLQILAQDNTGIKRYTITPGTSTSLAALVGGAGAQH